MNSNTFIEWQWLPNNDPVVPVAVVAWHDVAKRLYDYLIQNEEDKLTQYQIVKNKQVIIIIGDPESLPWVDGVQYATRYNNEARLWLPCHVKPSIPISLLAKAIDYKYQREPVLLWDHPKAIIPLDRQWPLTKEIMQNES